jgi:hypothetical protein
MKGRKMYIVLNYEKFQQRSSKNFINSLCKDIVLSSIILDEIPNVKQTTEDNASQRSKNICDLIDLQKSKNPEISISGMSGDICVNNLTEPKKLIELVTREDHSDLHTISTIQNGLKIHQKLSTLGTRFKVDPGLKLNEHFIDVDCSNRLLDLLLLGRNPHRMKAYDLFLEDTLEAITSLVQNFKSNGEKFILYGLFVGGENGEIVKKQKDFLKRLGVKNGVYNGSDKSGLNRGSKNISSFWDPLDKGGTQALIASKSISVGMDGLQKVCNNLIILIPPDTSAELVQLIRRLYRQGSKFKEVNVYYIEAKIYG